MIAGACADGYATFSDTYNGYMYVLGKGKSEMTVTAGPKTIAQGDSVVIEGTITDLSAAQPGTPCVSEDSMGAYMSYLHLQSQMQNLLHPDTVTGVPVSIDAIDPNGNFVHIADVTSDVSGSYSYMWKPDAVGKYDVTAAFVGSPSYGSSFAETAVGVTEAPATSTPMPTQQATVLPPYDLYIIGVGIAIIIAVAIATVLILRKK
jgi:hypothetical protein